MNQLVVFSDDWGRHPSSCQHLVGHLLDQTEVVWVNTIGTRPPRLDLLTLKRGAEKLRQWTLANSKGIGRGQEGNGGPANLTILNPSMLPWNGSKTSQRLNRYLLAKQICRSLEAESERMCNPCGSATSRIGVSTIPIASLVLDTLPVDRWIYYCVDDFAQWPGLDGVTLRSLEQQMVDGADTIICASEALCDRIAAMGRDSQLLTHGVDVQFWAEPARADHVDDLLRNIEKPLVVFWGVVDARLDSGWLTELSRSMSAGTILLVGPHQNPDPKILALPRVVPCGPVSFQHLPGIAQAADVLVMPYQDLPVTRAMQPLKLKEYLATGKPAIVRQLPATIPWNDCCDVVGCQEEFVLKVLERIQGGVPGKQSAARLRLEKESWANKAQEFWSVIQASKSKQHDEHQSARVGAAI